MYIDSGYQPDQLSVCFGQNVLVSLHTYAYATEPRQFSCTDDTFAS